jgi:hypothetical protein
MACVVQAPSTAAVRGCPLQQPRATSSFTRPVQPRRARAVVRPRAIPTVNPARSLHPSGVHAVELRVERRTPNPLPASLRPLPILICTAVNRGGPRVAHVVQRVVARRRRAATTTTTPSCRIPHRGAATRAWHSTPPPNKTFVAPAWCLPTPTTTLRHALCDVAAPRLSHGVGCASTDARRVGVALSGLGGGARRRPQVRP